MARNRRIRHIEVRQTVHLNAQEVILIDRLMETGLFDKCVFAFGVVIMEDFAGPVF